MAGDAVGGVYMGVSGWVMDTSHALVYDDYERVGSNVTDAGWSIAEVAVVTKGIEAVTKTINQGINTVKKVVSARTAVAASEEIAGTTAAGTGAVEGAGSVPSASSKVILAAEVKAPNAMKAADVTNAWDSYLGRNTTNINPRTGVIDADRIFSADGTCAIRFGNHEMASVGTPKGHFHYETWTYDAVNDVFNVTNTLQRIIP